MSEDTKYRTAYEEALANIKSGADPTGASMPSYITAADTLNIANGNQTFAESALDAVSSVPKFIAASLISGANQLYNIPADVGNLFGGDIERSDTGEVISSLDSDLGKFYEEHQEGTDLVGFMVSSLVPGMAGIKVLNAGQKSLRTAIGANKFGANTGKALGLLAPQRALQSTAYKNALLEVTTNSAAASLTNRNALNALASGFGQNALEALAFEVAVTATMFNSPILENQDFGDFMTNVAFGAGIFGIVGSAVDATKINSGLKAAANSAAIEARPWTAVAMPAAGSSSYEKVVLDFEQINNIPPVPRGTEPSRAAFLKASADTKRMTLENNIRSELGKMSNGDQDVAEVLFESFKTSSADRAFVGPRPVSNIQAQQSAFIGLVETTRMGAPAKIADRIDKIEAKMAKGTATTKEIDEFAESSIAVAYTKTWGEDIGRVTAESPRLTSLVDTIKPGELIEVTGKQVKAGTKKFNFDLRFNQSKVSKKGTPAKSWNILHADPFTAQARYIWADNLPAFKPTAKDMLKVHVNDIPLMEKIMLEVDPADFKFISFKGLKEGESIGGSLQNFVGDRKVMLANDLLDPAKAAATRTQEEIAAIVNMKSSALSGELVKDPVSRYHTTDILAMQHHADVYTQKLIEQGSRKAKEGRVPIYNVPQHVKLTYDTKPFKDVNNFIVENMVIIKQQQKIYQQGTSNASAGILGEDYYRFQDINSGQVFSGAMPSGAGAGFVHAASSNYGTLAASVENIGRTTISVIDKFKARTQDVLEPLLYKLGNNKEAAIEWSTLQQRVRAIEGTYGLNAAGDALEPLALIRWKRAAEEAVAAGKTPPKRPVLANPAMEERILIQNDATRKLIKAHIEVNGKRTNGLAEIRTAQGSQFNRDPDAFYPIPVNTTDFPHIASVIDDSITSGNHSKMLYASSVEELDGMIKKLKQNPHLRVLNKGETKDHFEARGQYEYEKSLNNNYLDTEAHRRGVSAPFFVPTDPKKIVDDMMNWHMTRESSLVREAVTAKYEVQFRELQGLGKESQQVSKSMFGSVRAKVGVPDPVNNPFKKYVDTALGVRPTESYPWWVWTNTMADEAVSKLMKKVTRAVETSKTEADLLEVNTMLERAGYKGAAYDESMEIFANAAPAKGLLTNIVQKANSVLATVVLRLDTLNAVNNAVSSNVLLGAETKAIMRAIGRGDAEAAGALAKLTRTSVPGTEHTIMSPSKLVGNAIKKFNAMDPASSPEFKFYKDNGFITSISDQYRSTLDDLTFNPMDGVTSWSNKIDNVVKKLRQAGDTGEKWTGNKLAEEFNRFVAADVMKQMSDVAISRGLMTAKEQLAYINTFVNRTQGNYLAAQRPMMFQGPIGQSIGLFQTYQFNLIQQLLRHVGEGHGKDAMTLLALQGTIHGMNGLPAFNAINTHLVGTASGNTEHKDAYDAVYGIAGKEAGDVLMYGLASNALGLLHPDLKINLYTRGDINPRHITIVPTDPSQIAFIQTGAKVFANIFETAKKLSQGGDVSNILLQGLEKNGMSRPLAGLAQTLQGLDNPMQASYSTSNRGNVIASNDLLSIANLGRVLGGKPLDEAIALDATYRYKAYALKDSRKRAVLGEAIKSTMLAGADPTLEQIQGFAESYAKTGGRQEEFNSWMVQLNRTANTSQANKISQSLNDPFSQSMQRLMGGVELEDFSDTAP
jgi:hypothetical protein